MKHKPKSDQSPKCLTFNSNVGSMKTVFKTLDELTADCDHFFTRFPITDLKSGQLDDYKRLLDEFKSRIEWPKSAGRSKKASSGVHTSTVTECHSPSDENALSMLAISDSDVDFQCYWPNCIKIFGQKNSLISHIESYHLRKERFKCCVEECGRTFSNKSSLGLHMTDAHSTEMGHQCGWTECHITVNSYHCPWPNCGQQFISKESTDKHMEDNHLKQYSMTSSDPKSNHFSSLNRKVESVVAKPMRCPHSNCTFEAIDKHDLKDHESQHKVKYIPINRRKDRSRDEDLSSQEPSNNKYTGD